MRFPFSTMVVPSARRAGGRLFEFIHRTTPAAVSVAEDEKDAA